MRQPPGFRSSRHDCQIGDRGVIFWIASTMVMRIKRRRTQIGGPRPAIFMQFGGVSDAIADRKAVGRVAFACRRDQRFGGINAREAVSQCGKFAAQDSWPHARSKIARCF